ncbi:hypothetical protein CPB84DRAFT_1758200, partial [Gymnopilus junonius]
MQIILTQLFSLAVFVWATHLHPSHLVLSAFICELCQLCCYLSLGQHVSEHLSW